MPVTIRIQDNEATVENGNWSSDDKATEMLVSLWTLDDIENYTAWPDFTLAEITAKALDGKIIRIANRPEYIEDNVY